MSVAAAPWMKFYPQDWRADEKLRMCSLAARGLWIEMLSIMHRSERYGQLLISGIVPTDVQLAVQVGASPSEVSAMLAELDGAGVFSRAASGAIYSRRMTRDAKKAKTARENGKTGGNPNLSKQRRNTASDNPPVKAGVKGGDKPQRPEARGQIPPNPQPLCPPDLRAVIDAAGMSHPPSDRQLLADWLALPDMQLERDILPIVRRVAANEMGRSGRAPFKLKLFDAAIREQSASDEAERERLRRTALRLTG